MSTHPAAGPPHIGPYQIFGRLAEGGESIVWAAVARSLGGFQRAVAVKCLRPAAAANTQRRSAFLYEAQLGGALHHPNLSGVTDVDIWDGRPYLVTELIRGWNLRSMLATAALTRTPVPLPAALSITHGAAEGLHYLHQLRGSDGRSLDLVHRAVDDENLMVARAGFPRVIDFGRCAPAGVEPLTPARRGSDFSAPEMAQPSKVDARADVYGLGVVLSRLVTQLDSDCPDDLWAVIERATADRPRNRFDSARDLQRSIEAVALAHDIALGQHATAGFLDRLFSPSNRSSEGTLPGLQSARDGQPRRPAPNGGRTRVRVTRGGPSQVSQLRLAPRRPREC